MRMAVAFIGKNIYHKIFSPINATAMRTLIFIGKVNIYTQLKSY